MSSESSAKGSKKSFVPKQQQLFLIEFLIDTVTIDSSVVDREVLEAQTCLTIRFLNFPPMDICEKDFNPEKEAGLDQVKFNSGKSLMFAFSETQCESPPPLLVNVSVNKKMPEGTEPARVSIGSLKICLAELFRQTYEVAKYKPDRLPASKSIRDCFTLVGQGKRTIGEVGVYIRLSCLGQNVVTEFQCGLDMKEDPILFKNREGKKVFEFVGNGMRSETDNEGYDNGNSFSEGCGCLGPASSPHKSRGQGDGSGYQSLAKTSPNAFMQGNKIVLKVPDKNGHKANNTCNYQVTKDSNMDKERNECPPTQSQVQTDADQNCFLLKVGDKGQIPDRGKMILEFRTPKQKIFPKVLPPYHEDVGVQTETPKKPKGGKKNKK